MGAVLSFERERELIFLRWLSEVERLRGYQVDRDAAFKAWTEGYSASQNSSRISTGRLMPLTMRPTGGHSPR